MEARILVGDAVDRLSELPDGSVRTCVTSPPYWGLRDYGNDGQIGLESTPMGFVENLCKVFDQVWRVLADDGTCWVNLGDTYSREGGRTAGVTRHWDGRKKDPGGLHDRKPLAKDFGFKPKELVGIPWRFAFAMQDRGWYLRQDIIWAKPNPMPESVTDRCTKSHEYIFLFSKRPKYYFDNEAIQEDAIHADDRRAGLGRLNYRGKRQGEDGTGQEAFVSIKEKKNKRSVWNVGVARFKDAHFAVYPPALITPCVLAGSAEGDTVLDPFSGSGTTGEVALLNGRNYVGVELNPDYAEISRKRLTDAVGLLGDVEVV